NMLGVGAAHCGTPVDVSKATAAPFAAPLTIKEDFDNGKAVRPPDISRSHAMLRPCVRPVRMLTSSWLTLTVETSTGGFVPKSWRSVATGNGRVDDTVPCDDSRFTTVPA